MHILHRKSQSTIKVTTQVMVGRARHEFIIPNQNLLKYGLDSSKYNKNVFYRNCISFIACLVDRLQLEKIRGNIM